jgi:lipoate---protein ligase
VLYQANKKIPGGKFIRVKLEADAQINAVRINGDFFLHPEDSLPEIEKSLTGLPADVCAPDVAQKIHETLALEKAAFLGVTPEYIAETIMEALQNRIAESAPE